MAAVELARALPVFAAFRHLAYSGTRARGLMRRRRASDASKERAARLLSAMMFQASLRTLLLLIAVVAPIAIVVIVGDAAGLHFSALFLNPRARLVLFGLSLTYAFARYHARKRLQPR